MQCVWCCTQCVLYDAVFVCVVLSVYCIMQCVCVVLSVYCMMQCACVCCTQCVLYDDDHDTCVVQNGL